jgi:hypothetical protein
MLIYIPDNMWYNSQYNHCLWGNNRIIPLLSGTSLCLCCVQPNLGSKPSVHSNNSDSTTLMSGSFFILSFPSAHAPPKVVSLLCKRLSMSNINETKNNLC